MARIKKNSAQLWDQVWQEGTTTQEDRYKLLKVEKSVVWRKLEKKILAKFGTLKGLKVIEIGAGTGEIGAIMAKRGADVTILDYSDNALARSRAFFKRNRIKAKFIKADALALPSKLKHKYNIAMSFGLAEHFLGKKRLGINKAHIDLLQKNKGIAVISVPHAYNPQYRLFKFLVQGTRFWKVGEEYPYSKREFYEMCDRFGIRERAVFGGSFIAAFNFFNPWTVFKRIFNIQDRHSTRFVWPEIRSPLDNSLGSSITLCAYS